MRHLPIRLFVVLVSFWEMRILHCETNPVALHSQSPLAQAVSKAENLVLRIPNQGAYTGAYIDWGRTEDQVQLEKIRAFEKWVGRHQAIVAFSSYWGKGTFPTEAVEIVKQYGAIPLIYWSPWGEPYRENEAQPQYALDHILEGRFDAYIEMWARHAKMVNYPLLVSWGLEMNGNWFPWGGPCQGGGIKDQFGDPHKPDGPEKYISTYRHIADRVRQAGAKNISWVFHAQNYGYPVESWNRMAAYYPGDDYVDWLGMSVYGKQYQKDKWNTFETVMKEPYHELCSLSPHKPVILAEWGVGEFPRDGNKAAFFVEAFKSLSKDYPRLKAAVYWHERWQNEDELYSNLRVNSSPRALEAYRQGVASPFWTDHPEFEHH